PPRLAGPAVGRGGVRLLRLLLGDARGDAGQAPVRPAGGGPAGRMPDRSGPRRRAAVRVRAVRSAPRGRLPDDAARGRRAARSDRRHARRATLSAGGTDTEDTLEPTQAESMEGAGLTTLAPAEEPRVAVAAPRHQIWRALWELVHDLSVAVLFCFFLI